MTESNQELLEAEDLAEEDAIRAEEDAVLAEMRAGRSVSHAAVRRWLLSMDTAEPLPRPQPGD